MEKTKQKLPKWFDGEELKEGSVVKNAITNEECELNNIELSMWNFMRNTALLSRLENKDKEIDELDLSFLNKGCKWFEKNNKNAWEILCNYMNTKNKQI